MSNIWLSGEFLLKLQSSLEKIRPYKKGIVNIFINEGNITGISVMYQDSITEKIPDKEKKNLTNKKK